MTACAEGLRLENTWIIWNNTRVHRDMRYLINQTRHAWARWQAHRDTCKECIFADAKDTWFEEENDGR